MIFEYRRNELELGNMYGLLQPQWLEHGDLIPLSTAAYAACSVNKARRPGTLHSWRLLL